MARTIGDEYLDFFDSYKKSLDIDDAMDIGKVVNLEPLKIKIDGLVLDEDNLVINPYLKQWTETVNAHTTTNLDHSHTVINITHPSKLNINTKVFCYGFEYDEVAKTYQRYYVLEVVG